MNEVKLNINENGKGAFNINVEEKEIGEMVISVSGKNLTVHHTNVDAKYEGQGWAKKLLNAMVEYARKNGLKVIPLCPYVHAQFKRRADEFKDIWEGDSTTAG